MKMVFCVAGQDGWYFWYDVVHLMQTQPSNQPSNHPTPAARWKYFKSSGVNPRPTRESYSARHKFASLIGIKLVYNLPKVRAGEGGNSPHFSHISRRSWIQPHQPTLLGCTVAVGTLLADTVYNNDECIMISPESGSSYIGTSTIWYSLYSIVIWPSHMRCQAIFLFC